MDEFIIKKGLSYKLFDENGNILIPIEEHCWYLTTDTAEVYICIRDDSDNLILKRANDYAFDSVESEVEFCSTKNNLPLYDRSVSKIYVVNDENASYRWTGSEWVCISRDYKEVQVIYGGDSKSDTN